MSTILRPLSSAKYTSAKAVTHFYPHVAAPINDDVPAFGYRLGDQDEVSVQVSVADDTTRESTEYGVPTTVTSNPGAITVSVRLTLVQYSDLVRALAVMGEVGVQQQYAEVGIEKDLPLPGVYYLGDYGYANAVVTVGGAPAVEGTDYMGDPVSGQIETFKPNMSVIYDKPEVNDGFITGIASTQGVRGMIIIRNVNLQGVQSLVRIHDLQLRPDGARQFVIAGSDNGTITLVGTAFPVAGKPRGFEIGYERDITPAA